MRNSSTRSNVNGCSSAVNNYSSLNYVEALVAFKVFAYKFTNLFCYLSNKSS